MVGSSDIIRPCAAHFGGNRFNEPRYCPFQEYCPMVSYYLPVYALYERDKRVLMIFGFIIVTEFICTFIGVGRTIAGGVVSIEALLLRTPKAFVNFGCVVSQPGCSFLTIHPSQFSCHCFPDSNRCPDWMEVSRSPADRMDWRSTCCASCERRVCLPSALCTRPTLTPHSSVAFVILMAMTVATTMSSLMDSKYAPLIYQ